MSQTSGKHIFLEIIPGADQKQNFDNYLWISNFMPRTQLSAEDVAVNKTHAVSALTELRLQGTCRKDKCQTNKYNKVWRQRWGYQSEAEIVTDATNIMLLCPPPNHIEALTPPPSIRKWGLRAVIRFRWGHKSRAPMMGLAPQEEAKTKAHFLFHVWGHSEKAASLPGSRPSPSQTCQHLDLGLLSL